MLRASAAAVRQVPVPADARSQWHRVRDGVCIRSSWCGFCALHAG